MAALCLAGCDGDKNSPGGGGGGGGGSSPVPIRGGERLGWRQAADSLQGLRQMIFRLYVGENFTELTETRCGDALISGAYECSGRLPFFPPGRYDLQLSAISPGIGESARSAPLAVIVGAGSNSDVSDTAGASGATLTATTACVASMASGDCYDVHGLASGLRDVEWLTPADSGVVFFVEGRARVRVIRDEILVEWPALTTDTATGGQIVGLAVDPDFARTRHVFVAIAESGSDGTAALTVTRYRELEGILGEGAPVVTGLPIDVGATAPLGLDHSGFLYVALPSKVLRFTTDGFVPRVNLNGSPVIAATSPDSVAGLTVDPSTGRVWIVLTGDEWPHGVATFPRTVEQEGKWPAHPAPPDRLFGWSSASRATSVGFAPPSSGNGSWLLVSTGKDLLRGVSTPSGITQLQPVLFDAKTSVRSAAGARDQSWYVLVGEADSDVAIWKLTHR